MTTINDIVAASHTFVSQAVDRGDTVVDATAGNGHDTLFLARIVGDEGKVHAFDIQRQALENSLALLAAHNCAERVQLHLADHGELAKYIVQPVNAVMFNLGYLPGGKKKQITTSTPSTRRALNACLGLLALGGIISVVTYSGHNGGEEEEAMVADWCQSLPAGEFTASSFALVNKSNRPPKLWLIRRGRAMGEVPPVR